MDVGTQDPPQTSCPGRRVSMTVSNEDPADLCAHICNPQGDLQVLEAATSIDQYCFLPARYHVNVAVVGAREPETDAAAADKTNVVRYPHFLIIPGPQAPLLIEPVPARPLCALHRPRLARWSRPAPFRTIL